MLTRIVTKVADENAGECGIMDNAAWARTGTIMTTEGLNGVLGRLRWSAATQIVAERSDGDLLAAFIERRDEGAFEALMRRHGPMVLGVCRRVLGCRQDVEDAFQAVFLVLVRKASSIAPKDLVGNWLYGVAHQTAIRLRAQNLKRQNREKQTMATTPEPAAAPESGWNELRPMLDEELGRLPDRYRAVIVLCDVEGRTRKDAARHLRCPEGSVSSRLARARAMLSRRLARRGIALSGGTMSALIAKHAAARIPHGLFISTLQCAVVPRAASMFACGYAVGQIPQKASRIAQEMLGAMAVKKTILTGVLVSALILGSSTCGLVVHHWQSGQNPDAAGVNPKTPPTKAQHSPEELVRQLNDNAFANREAAEKALLALGAKAIPAVRAGTMSSEQEVARRCERLLPLIRLKELTRFVEAFQADIERKATFDHPIWKRYVSMVGDSKPSRELFAAILKRDDWVRNLDAADADPAKAGDLYRSAVREIGKRYESNLTVRFMIPIWPCDQPEEVAYVLLLGSYKNTDPKYPLSQQDASDRQFADGESRIRFGRGLDLAFRGKRLAIDPKKRDHSIVIDDAGGNAAESGRVMLLLLAHWLEQRNCWPVVAEHLKALSAPQQKQLLPFARRVIADGKAPVLCRATWISVLRRFGDSSDAAFLTPLFADKSGMDWPSTTRFGEGPGNLRNQAEVREVAIGSAIFLRGRDPVDFGFRLLANQKRGDDIRSMLFPVLGRNDEKEKTLKRAIQWLADEEEKEQKPAPPTKLNRDPEPPGELQAELARLDKEYRHGSEEKYLEFEAKAAELLKQYPQRQNQARILFHVAHVAAQGGITKQVERVRRYGQRMLAISQDPVQRGTMYSYLGSAAEVDPTVKPIAQRRRLAAEPLLQGYAEVLAQDLPEKKPARPPLGPIRNGPDDDDPNAHGAAQAREMAQMEAYKQAVFVENLISRRDTLIQQLRWLYRPNLKVNGRNAEGPEELRSLAMKRLHNKPAVDALLEKIVGPEGDPLPRTPNEPKWMVTEVNENLVQIAVGSKQGLKVGDILVISRPVANRPLVGKIRIVCVDENDSIGQLIEKTDHGVEKHDIATRSTLSR